MSASELARGGPHTGARHGAAALAALLAAFAASCPGPLAWRSNFVRSVVTLGGGVCPPVDPLPIEVSSPDNVDKATIVGELRIEPSAGDPITLPFGPFATDLRVGNPWTGTIALPRGRFATPAVIKLRIIVHSSTGRELARLPLECDLP